MQSYALNVLHSNDAFEETLIFALDFALSFWILRIAFKKQLYQCDHPEPFLISVTFSGEEKGELFQLRLNERLM